MLPEKNGTIQIIVALLLDFKLQSDLGQFGEMWISEAQAQLLNHNDFFSHFNKVMVKVIKPEMVTAQRVGLKIMGKIIKCKWDWGKWANPPPSMWKENKGTSLNTVMRQWANK